MWHSLWALYTVIMIAFSTEYSLSEMRENEYCTRTKSLIFQRCIYTTIFLSALGGQYPYHVVCSRLFNSSKTVLHSDPLRLQYEVARYIPSPRHWLGPDKPYFQAPSAAQPVFRPVIVLQKSWIQHVHISFIQAGQPVSSQFWSDNKFAETQQRVRFNFTIMKS